MKITVDEIKLKYIGLPKGWLGMIFDMLSNWVEKMFTTTPVHPPYKYRDKKILSAPTYQELGKSIRLNEELTPGLQLHKKRVDLYFNFVIAIYALFAILIIAIVVVVTSLFENQTKAIVDNPVFPVALGLLIGILSFRLALLLVEKYFADTLAALTGIYLLLTLDQDYPLTDPVYKRRLLGIFRTLRRNLILLALTYSTKSSETDPRIRAYFKHMEEFILENECLVIIPGEGTKQNLLNALNPFVEILVTGEYGKFEPITGEISTQVETQKPPKTFLEMLIRFLLSVFPFLLLVVLILVPDKVAAIGLDTNTVFLVALAWILLVIDASLKLGIVERAAGLAKTIKEIGKL